MGINISSGVGDIANLADDVVKRFFPDKTAEEQAQLAATMSVITGQLQINLAAEQGKSMLQHFRDGAGWVCVFGFAWAYVAQPLLTFIIDVILHFMGQSAMQLPTLNEAPMQDLLMGLLGLGGMHLYGTTKGKS